MKKLFYVMSLVTAMAFVLTSCDNKAENSNPRFDVSFDSRGGSALSVINIESGSKITRPEDPTYGDYIFVGWFKEAAGINAWDFNTDVVSGITTLYGKWTTVQYTVTFSTNGGSTIAPVTVAQGSPLAWPLPPTKTDFAFDGWYTNTGLTTPCINPKVVTSDITIYAKWSNINSETLTLLLDEVSAISSHNYTNESYSVFRGKCSLAEQVISSGGTVEEIATAYNDLKEAIEALEALPQRDVAQIEITSSFVDGFAYVNPGESFYFYVYAMDSQGDYASDTRVIFSGTQQLAAWAEGDVSIDGQSIYFSAKTPLTAGQVITISAKSAANPTISKTFTLKVAASGEMKTKFLAAIDALPAPSAITYDHYALIERAYNIYGAMSYSERNESTANAAYEKLYLCSDAYWELPQRLFYSFAGNVCTTFSKEDNVTNNMNFVAAGAFPFGSYTLPQWTDESGDGLYTQERFTLKSSGIGAVEMRSSSSANGSGATDWEEVILFTYTYSGNKTSGGIFYFSFPPANESRSAQAPSGVAKPSKRLFKR